MEHIAAGSPAVVSTSVSIDHVIRMLRDGALLSLLPTRQAIRRPGVANSADKLRQLAKLNSKTHV
ncbi:MAG: hypothetical protein GY758_16550 [Fuerstiella sp.]|jgi:hypothetical protein|nr:hypothetical protein [Fuerstiella sp.]MCP4510759.1 hypothetical protein [Fuerstiella sp.]MDG2129984.1 hypothetical protein [Fuerstiella sp.]